MRLSIVLMGIFFAYTVELVSSYSSRIRTSSEDIITARNFELFITGKPKIKPCKFINQTPYLVAIDDVKNFTLVAIVPAQDKVVVETYNHQQSQALWAVKLYDQSGNYVPHKDTTIAITQPHEFFQYESGKDFTRILNYAIAHPAISPKLSKWRLSQCYDCNIGQFLKSDCSQCFKASQDVRVCSSIAIDLLLRMKEQSIDKGIIEVGYKCTMQSEALSLHSSLHSSL